MELTEGQLYTLKKWINKNCIQAEEFNHDINSYGLKHEFEYDPNGFYVVNDVMKDMMLECGFKLLDKCELNWEFNIHPLSPVFVKRFYSSQCTLSSDWSFVIKL